MKTWSKFFILSDFSGLGKTFFAFSFIINLISVVSRSSLGKKGKAVDSAINIRPNSSVEESMSVSIIKPKYPRILLGTIVTQKARLESKSSKPTIKFSNFFLTTRTQKKPTLTTVVICFGKENPITMPELTIDIMGKEIPESGDIVHI